MRASLVVALLALLALVGVVRASDMSADMGDALEAEEGQLVDMELDAGMEMEMEMEMDAEMEVDADASKVDYINEKSGPAIWKMHSNRFVANSFMGIAIGNIPKDSHVVCESYRTGQKTKADMEKASFCWGYLKKPAGYFGGYHGKTSCGFYPIIRTVGKVKQRAHRVKVLKDHKDRCGPQPKSVKTGPLRDSKLFMPKSYITGTGVGSTRKVAAGAAGCQAYLNYDPITRRPRNKYAMIAPGTKMGHRYNTKRGGFSLVKADGLDPAGDFKWFFIKTKCLQEVPKNDAPQAH